MRWIVYAAPVYYFLIGAGSWLVMEIGRTIGG